MSTKFPLVPLGRVIRHRKEFVEISDLERYKRCRVQLHAKGIVLRDAVPGSEIKTKSQQVCRAGDFLVAEIDAKVGGFGIVPDDLDGAIVSSHYFLLEIDETALDRRFLGFFIRTQAFREQVSAQGSTNYAAIRPDDVLRYEIPLPPLDEQRRIVARIEQLSAKIEEARKLRREAVEMSDRLLIAMAHRNDLDPSVKRDQGWVEVSLSEVLKEVREYLPVEAGTGYPNVGIYSFARGIFAKPPIDGGSTSARALKRIRAGQFIYSRLFAFEGAYGMVEEQFDGCFVSNEYPTFECDTGRISPEYLFAHFKAPSVWSRVAVGSKGLGHRRQRVQPDQFLAYRLMLPPIEYQSRLRLIQRKMDSPNGFQKETMIELGVLLPAILKNVFKGEPP